MIVPINSGINSSIIDYDAREFIRIARITDSTHIRAVNDLCKELKGNNLWNKFVYIYPFIYVNGYTNSMYVELKSRQIGLTESSSGNDITYSSKGVKFNQGKVLEQTSLGVQPGILTEAGPGHISVYTRLNSITQSSYDTYTPVNGYFNTTGGGIGGGWLAYSFGTQSVRFSFMYTGLSASGSGLKWQTFTTSTNTSGLWIYSANSENNGLTASSQNPFTYSLSQNGNIQFTFSNTRQWTGFGNVVALGGGNYVTYSNKSLDEICWYSIGWSGSPTWSGGRIIEPDNHAVLYNIIQKFQTTLGRQV